MKCCNHPLHVAVSLALLGTLLAVLIPIGTGTAAPGGDRIIATSSLFQADDGYPTSVTLEGEQFLFDRLVPLDSDDLEQVDEQDDLAFFARSDEPPFETLYALRSDSDDAGLARYLPTNVDNPDIECAAEALQVGPLAGGEETYAFAGLETDIPTDELEQIGQSDDQPVYADPEADQPSPELFLENEDGLLRFVLTGEQGLPVVLPDELPFAGQTYAFEGDATDEIDPETLTKVGCIGPFPAFSEQPEAPFEQVYVEAAGRYLSFVATGSAQDEADGPTATPAESQIVPTDDEGEDGQEDQQQPGDEEQDDQQQPEDEGDEGQEDQQLDEATQVATPGDDGEDGPDGLSVQFSENLGDAGQPDGLPREVVLEDARYLFDRLVPLSPGDLSQVAQGDNLTVYAQGEESPFEAVYVAQANGDGQLARYLPEHLDEPEIACPAEAANFEPLSADETTYAFAGYETDLTPDVLEQIGDSGGQPVYAAPNADQPVPELFIQSDDGLLRFIALNGDGLPAALVESLALGGAQYPFVAEVTDQVNLEDLTKVGCSPIFPVYAEDGGAEDGFTVLYVSISGRIFHYGGEEAPVEATPTETATEEPTEAPTEAPTETPTEVPTETPTEAPTETSTEEPTQTPTETAEPTDVPTETPAPTETAEPTETATPTETAAPTETPTPAETPTETVVVAEETPEATDVPATASPTPTATPERTSVPQTAAEANLPQRVEVQNTSYVFNEVEVEIDLQALVLVEVIVVQNVELMVYAESEVQGVAPRLYCVVEGGEIVGEYVPAAGIEPSPPETLPAAVEIENTTYVFNEIEINVNIQTLVQIEVVVIDNVELTIYADPDVPGQPRRIFAVSPAGEVVGQYVESSLVFDVQAPQPTPTSVLRFETPVTVPTLPAGAQAPASTAIPTDRCTGPIGPLGGDGIPAYLPNRIQFGGTAYTFAEAQDPGEVGTLTRIGCIGPFEVATTDQADRSEVLYLRVPGTGEASQRVYRFEAALTFTVNIQVEERPRVVSAGEQQYRLVATWLPSFYSSTTVILFAEDPEIATPELYYAVNVYNTVVGEVIGEYRLPGETTEPSDEIMASAEEVGLNPDLTINGQRYLLVAIYEPVGTTTNGFVTLFSSEQDGTSDILLGRDKRRLELFVYDSIEDAPAGG